MFSQYRILMVDDSVRYHKLYESAITEALFAKVVFASNGVEALALLETDGPFDLMILDLSMPSMGGEQVLQNIRKSPALDTMPVVILTGHSDKKKQNELLDLGADDFIEKGSSPETFVSRIKAQLRYRRALDKLSRLAVDMDIFAAGVLHDIRNLETNILAVATIMEDALDSDPKVSKETMIQDLKLLDQKAERLGQYAHEVMKVVRKTSLGLQLASQDLKEVILWAREMGELGKKVQCTFLGPMEPVLADLQFLKLAMLNILSNTVKYRIPQTEPRLEISQVKAKSYMHSGEKKLEMSSSRVVTILRDFGLGIPAEDLDRVFEPFVRGSQTTKDGGFGLGLSLVSKVIHTMGGRIWAEAPDSGPGVKICVELTASHQE